MSKVQKHPCVDCKMCQWCSDERCRLCLKTGCGKKLSIREQIVRYERLNSENLNNRQTANPEDRGDNA
ncbi:MAG: hypothetical protein GW875_00685 [Deltaproteobacteria bacterium]|nr:hypothetical protein [Deltaproteobacteria bacterium]NCP03013.1 hypothetical protein [Deltaproteobacteria bacterium]